jgi:riboflavin synthase
VFTGIVTQRARVAAVVAGKGPAAASRFTLALSADASGVAPRVGDSVAIDGVCLTVAEIGRDGAAFDVVPETLRRTTLGSRRAGDLVNVEFALRTGDVLGGHLVAGHVEGVGTVVDVRRSGEDVRMEIALPESLHHATISKGSIAVDGVSLTVGESDEATFSVYLVPHTLRATGLGEKGAGDPVNLEPDLVGRWVEHHVRRMLRPPTPRPMTTPAPEGRRR